uniref:Transmembrane protein 33 n=1 Tax=Castor canadensis TaxID=51338 RepID=A0A8C0W2W4_CASCN
MADTTPNGPQGAGAVQFMMTNKLDTAMWLSRLFTVYCSALFVLPLLGYVLFIFLTFIVSSECIVPCDL